MSDHLKEHMKTHTCQKSHQCNVCEKYLSTNASLKKHMLTHTGEKLYYCNVCEKTFSINGHLKVHMLTHTAGESYIHVNFVKTLFLPLVI